MDALAWPQILAALLGGGGIGAIATAWVRAHVVDRKTEARLAELENQREDAVRAAALSLVAEMREQVREGREETGQHQTQYVDCERRCAELAAENRALKTRIDDLEATVKRLEGQVEKLLPEALKGYALSEDDTRPATVHALRREKA